MRIDCSKEDASSKPYVVMTLNYSFESGICFMLNTRTAGIVTWQVLDAFLSGMIRFGMGIF